MASKTPKKRARLDAVATKDSTSSSAGNDVGGPSRCRPSPPNLVTAGSKTSGVGGDTGDSAGDDGATSPTCGGQLRAELESARRCIEQLRREKADEARRARQQADTELRQTADRLRQDRQRVIEQVRQRCAAESSRAAAKHRREVDRLRSELDRCRTELRDELEKRGGGGGGGGGGGCMDAGERARLLQKVADAVAGKRRAEEALRSADDADRQKAADIRRLREDCCSEVARVSKEANQEVIRLLEELKMKDHQLALLDRNQYPDRGIGLAVRPMTPGECSTIRDQDTAAAAAVATAAASTWAARSDKALKRSDLLQAETAAGLRGEVERLTSELKTSETDRASMKEELDKLKHEIASLRQPTAVSDLGKPSPTENQAENVNCAEVKQRNVKSDNQTAKPQPKAVRFLLPGETLPVLARETPTTTLDDDGTASVNSDASDTASLSSASSTLSSSSSSSLRLSPDSMSLYDENLEKNYHLLLSEHLSLQHNVANLLTSWTQTSPVLNSKPEKHTCGQDCASEKESMRVTVETLRDKLGKCEETEHQLRQQLKDQQEQNEELEFRMLELEECLHKNKSDDEGDYSVLDLLEKNQSLEIEVSVLRQKLSESAADPKTAAPSDAVLTLLGSPRSVPKIDTESRDEVVAGVGQEDEVVERQEGRSPEVDGAGEKVSAVEEEEEEEAPECDSCLIAETAVVDGGSDGTTDDEQFGLMTCSLSSTTSGFDDNSCASSVVGGDEMPSEETWNFDVHEESCRQETAAVEPEDNDRENSRRGSGAGSWPPVRQTTITEEQWKQMEKIWLSRVEKLERRLRQAVEGEQRARDQIALLSEEKDRRIVALERQLDALEANDVHLTNTIHTLEQLERAFRSHFLRVIDAKEPHHLAAERTVGGMLTEENENFGDDKMGQADLDQIATKSGYTGLGLPCNDRACLQCRVCQTLKGTIEKLHSALAEQGEVDRRVRELEEDTADDRSATANGQAALEVVDFEAEYRELEALVRELKRVLVVDRSEDGYPEVEDASLFPEDICRKENERASRISALSLDTMVRWKLDDVGDDDDETISMVATPDSEIDPPALAALNGRNRQLEISEQYLRQQVSDLEMERDQLREMVRSGEATIAELGTGLAELHNSEKSVSDEASRLRTKNEWMSARIDGLLELVGRLERADREHRAAAGELRLRAERASAGEADVRRELENAVDEGRRAETRCRRWVAQLEDERDALAARVDELSERNSELEGREAALECRVRKMETVERGLRSELADLERALDDNRAEIFEERPLSERFPADHDDDFQYSELPQYNCRTTGVIAFLKQKLERVDSSNAALQDRLNEKEAREDRLREAIREYEKCDGIWQEKIISLETQKKTLMQKIVDLQAQLTDVKQRHQFKEDALSAQTVAHRHQLPEVNDAERGVTYGLKDRKASPTKGCLLVLDTVAEDSEDMEQANWVADDHRDSAVTSPHSDNVALNVEAGEDEETVVKQLHNQAVEKETVETQKMIDDSSPDDTELSSLLPDASHPPEPEVALVSQPTTGSSIPAAADDPFESTSSVSLKCADRKPDIQKVFADRKLIVVRAADIRRSRSADIFRPDDDVATTSGPATARAQSETRDVIDSWNALSKAQQSLALENLTSPLENGIEDDDEAHWKEERKDDALNSAEKINQESNVEEAQVESGSVAPGACAVRPSLIPRIAPTQTSNVGSSSSSSSGSVSCPRSPAVMVADSPGSRSVRPGSTVVVMAAAAAGGQTQASGEGRRTPKPTLSSSRSLIPRPVNDCKKISCGDDGEKPAASTTEISHTMDKPTDEYNAETSTKSSLFLGSPSSTDASVGDAKPELGRSLQARPSSVSSTSSCPGTDDDAPDCRE